MRGFPVAVVCTVMLLGCAGGRPPLVGSGPDGRCPPGKAAIFDKPGGKTYVCQDEQLVLFVTCIERVAAPDATAICARFAESRTEKPCAEIPAPVQAALPARHEPPSPMSDVNPYGDTQRQ